MRGQCVDGRILLANRLIGALADAHYARTASAIERYQKAVASAAHAMICDTDKKEAEGGVTAFLEQANAAMAAMVKEKTDTCLARSFTKRAWP